MSDTPRYRIVIEPSYDGGYRGEVRVRDRFTPEGSRWLCSCTNQTVWGVIDCIVEMVQEYEYEYEEGDGELSPDDQSA